MPSRVKLACRAGFSGGGPVLASARPAFCLTGSGGGTSSQDELLMVDSMLFCDGDDETRSCRPFVDRARAAERRSLDASERSGRFEVSCCVSSITTGGAGSIKGHAAAGTLTASVDDDGSKEFVLDPKRRQPTKPEWLLASRLPLAIPQNAMTNRRVHTNKHVG